MLALQQPDVLQREAEEASEPRRPAPRSRAQAAAPRPPHPALAPARGPAWLQTPGVAGGRVPGARGRLRCSLRPAAAVPRSAPHWHPRRPAITPSFQTRPPSLPGSGQLERAQPGVQRGATGIGRLPATARHRPVRLRPASKPKRHLGSPVLSQPRASRAQAPTKVRRIDFRQDPPSSGARHLPPLTAWGEAKR